MSIDVQLAQRYYVKEETYIDNTDNYSFHNHYETMYDLVPIAPQNLKDDIISYNQKEVARGHFLGHPNDDKSLYLLQTGSKIAMYENDLLLMDGDNLYIYGNLCVQVDKDTNYIVDLKDNSELAAIEGKKFNGYDAEKKLFDFDGKLYSLSKDGKLDLYQSEPLLVALDLPTHNIKANATTKYDQCIQDNTYKEEKTHNYNIGVSLADGSILQVAENRQNKQLDKDSLYKLYYDRMSDYNAAAKEKDEINRIKQAYTLLYNEDINSYKDKEGRTAFEKLCYFGFEKNFPALRAFYSKELKNETNTQLHISFDSEKFYNDLVKKNKITQDDIKLIGDFIKRNPKVWSPYEFSNEGFMLLAKASPDMVISLIENRPEMREELKKHSTAVRSITNDIMQSKGKTFYYVEDIILAPNKEFWEQIKDNGFGPHIPAIKKLCNSLKYTKDTSNSIYAAKAKKLLAELLQKDDVKDNLNKLYSEDLDVLKKLQLLPEEKDDTTAPKKEVPALDTIVYNKRDIDIYNIETITDFSDFRDVARLYHPSCGSKTTFLNEMLIYNKGQEAAYALSHGASPFQKIEFFKGKKSGLPFAGVFLRTKKENFKGVQSLMNKIAQNLDINKGQKIISDIEKSLGQNLRQNPVINEIMKNMRETFMQTKLQKIQQQKEIEQQQAEEQRQLEESRKFHKEHIKELEELDVAYRLATRTPVDNYTSIIDNKDKFSAPVSELYTPESIAKLKTKIQQIDEQNNLIEYIDKQLKHKDEDTGKSLIDRYSEFGYKFSKDDNQIRCEEGYHTKFCLYYDKDTLEKIERFIKEKEDKRQAEQQKQQQEQRQREEQEKVERQKVAYKAHCKEQGIPTDIEIWHRTGGRTNCGEGWVIDKDGNSREPDNLRNHGDYTKQWELINPTDVVLSWEKASTASEHEFNVIYMPKDGLTPQQKEQILKIEEEIHEDWKDSRSMSGKPSPSVEYGWDICDRKAPLLRDDEQADLDAQKREEEEEKKQFATHTKEEATPARPIEQSDLAMLMAKFNNNKKKR